MQPGDDLMNIFRGATADGRDLSVKAAQIMSLINFQVSSGAPTFSPGLSVYDDLLDPSSSDVRRLEASQIMLKAVNRQAEHERYMAEKNWFARGYLDPYSSELRLTQRGVMLELIAEMLSNAIKDFTVKG